MKKLVTLAMLLLAAVNLYAQESEPEHLLDGTSMNYYYQNGTAVHVEFTSGEITYLWISGSNSGSTGTQPYMSRKVGEKMYLVNFIAANSTFVTLLFNFSNNVMYSSVISLPTTEDEAVIFDGGIIENLTLVEK